MLKRMFRFKKNIFDNSDLILIEMHYAYYKFDMHSVNKKLNISGKIVCTDLLNLFISLSKWIILS